MRSLANNGTHFENIIERQQLHQYSYCVRFLIVRIFAKCQRQILHELTQKSRQQSSTKKALRLFIVLILWWQNVVKLERKLNECKIQTLYLTA